MKNKENKENLLFLFILAAAAGLRIYALDGESMWVDEIGHARAAAQPSLSLILAGVKSHAAAAPLDYLLLSLYMKLNPDHSAFGLRLIYVIYGFLSVVVIYLLGRSIEGKSLGFAAAFALAVSPLQIYYSQEVRFYSLSVLIALLSTLLFLEALKNPSKDRWAWWGVINLAGLYTHYYLSFLILVQLMYLLLLIYKEARRKHKLLRMQIKPVGITLLAMVLGFLPWLLYVWPLSAGRFDGFYVPFGGAFLALLSSWGQFYWVIGLLLFLFFGMMVKEDVILLAGLALVPFLGAFWADNAGGYFFNSRQVIFSQPFFILGFLMGGQAYAQKIQERFKKARKWRPQQVLALFAVLYLVMNLPLLGLYYKENQKPNWPMIVNVIESGQLGESVRFGVINTRDQMELSVQVFGFEEASQPGKFEYIDSEYALAEFIDAEGAGWLVISVEGLNESDSDLINLINQAGVNQLEYKGFILVQVK